MAEDPPEARRPGELRRRVREHPAFCERGRRRERHRHQLFTDSAARWADRPFLCVLPETAAIYGIEAGELSYRDADARIAALRDA